MKAPSPVIMDAERWQKVSAAFFSAMDIGPERRDLFLAHRCSDDPSLLDEVRSLVAAHLQAGEFIQSPALGAGIPLLDDAAATAMEGRKFGPYRVVREIAHGGMGVVYLAHRDDGAYQQQVAIKIVRSGLDTESNLRRFRSERQILANLEHPYIARLLDGGASADGLPYLVMEYVDGQPIDQYCNVQRLSISNRLQLFLKVCSAVQHAHEHLIIHRDLKPGNILITPAGDPKLLDFGIARLLNWDPAVQPFGHSKTWMGPMTPDYASPEQVRGETITTATDVYSLGTLLYELLSGHRPYRTEGCLPHEVLQAICEVMPERPSARIYCIEQIADPQQGSIVLTPERVGELRDERPERLRRRLMGDLDNIVLLAMRKEPQQRYSSVAEFTADVIRHLEGRPVIARKATLAYRGGKFLRKRWNWVVAAALIALGLIVAIVAGWQTRIATTSRLTQELRFAESIKSEFLGRQARAEASRTRRDQAEATRRQEEAEQLRKGLLKQLSNILEAHDTSRGLVVKTSEVIFDPGRVTLRPDARERLAKIAGVLAVYPTLRLQVEGHTDNGGDDALNLQVSEDRARAVKEYLAKQRIPEKMITAQGFGGGRPIASNNNDLGRQRNRRVEIVISGDVIGGRPGQLSLSNSLGAPIASAKTRRSTPWVARAAPGSPNLALGKAAKGSPACNSSEGLEKAFNGSVAGGHDDKWCSHATPAFLQVDLGAIFSVREVIVKHAGAGGELAVLNTRDFSILASEDGTNFTTVAEVTGNTQSTTTHLFNPAIAARFVRLNITNPAQGGDSSSRIYELEVYSLVQSEPVPE